jgi:hypothetical protein
MAQNIVNLGLISSWVDANNGPNIPSIGLFHVEMQDDVSIFDGFNCSESFYVTAVHPDFTQELNPYRLLELCLFYHGDTACR